LVNWKLELGALFAVAAFLALLVGVWREPEGVDETQPAIRK
jgi:hypothetical protein